MTKIVIERIDTAILQEYLESYPNMAWKKTWALEELVIGFLEYKPHVKSGDCVLNVVYEIDETKLLCNIEIRSHGTACSSSESSKLDMYVSQFIDRILLFADKCQWKHRLISERRIE